MQMLYDSDSFVVVHMVANDPSGLVPHDPFEFPRKGFEIVDKRTNKEVYLDGAWAAAFQEQVKAWELDTPTAEEVETYLDGLCGLAQLPLVIH